MRGSRFLVAGVMFSAGVAMVIAQQRQPGGGGFGGGGGPTTLVANKAVQEDIKMTEEQIEKLKTWAKDFREKRTAIMEAEGIDAKDFKAAFDPANAEKMAAANAKVTKEAYKQLGEVLKPEQVKRIKQIDVQNSGVNAFTNPEVVEALKLTDDQKTTVKALTAEFRKDSGEIRTEAGLGGGKGGGGKGAGGKGGGMFDPAKMAEMNKKIAKIQKETMDKISEKLTADQVKAWKELTGEAFDTSKLVPTFGGGAKKKDAE